MPETVSAKRLRIIDAAQSLFLQQGLRGTSMEAIARQAGVAKPTLYKQFSDKQAVFDALLARLLGELRRIAEAAFSGPGTAAERAASALSGKHKFLFQFLDGSPHAGELYMTPKLDGSESLAAFDRWLMNRIISAFVDEGRTDGASLAPLLMAACEGISRRAKHVAEIGPAVRFTVSRLSTRP